MQKHIAQIKDQSFVKRTVYKYKVTYKKNLNQELCRYKYLNCKALCPDHVILLAFKLHTHRSCLRKPLSFVNTEICWNVLISDWTWCCYCYVSECRWPCPGQRRASWETRFQPVSCSRVRVILKHVQGHELTLWSLPSDANISSACRGILRILWNPEVHYHIHNSPSHVPEPHQCSPYHRPISWRYISILSSPLRLGLRSALFPSSFPTKAFYATRSLYFCWLKCFHRDLNEFCTFLDN